MAAGFTVPLEENAEMRDGLPVAIYLTYHQLVAVTIEILCRVTKRAFSEWQLKTYEDIMSAYLNLKSQYDEQLAAAAVEQGITILGRNPAQNREIEKN